MEGRLLCKPTCSFDPPFCRRPLRHVVRGSRARIDCGRHAGRWLDGAVPGANRFVKALNRCLLLCGYTLAGPPSRTKCGTCSIYGVHCSPKWLVRALHKGLITTGCPRRGFRLGRRLPEASPRALRPHHHRLRGHQKAARHQKARATRHHRTADCRPTARISRQAKSATCSPSACGLQSVKVSTLPRSAQSASLRQRTENA